MAKATYYLQLEYYGNLQKMGLLQAPKAVSKPSISYENKEPQQDYQHGEISNKRLNLDEQARLLKRYPSRLCL